MKDNRLQWLDALRGLTMVLVVAFHSAIQGYGEVPHRSTALPLLLLLRMPAFFFVSGFLAYKAGFSWGLGDTLAQVWKKVRVQIVPTAVFLSVFVALRKPQFCEGMLNAWHSPTKGGYWFCIALLWMFIIYYAVGLLARHRHWPMWLLWLISLAFYETMYLPKHFTYFREPFFLDTSLIMVVKHFHFFVAGNLVHRHWAGAQRVLDSRWCVPLLIVVAFLGAGDYIRWHNLRMAWANLPRTLAMYAMVTLLFAYFRHYASLFSQSTRLGRTLQYIGTRTLDIYLLHFILIPTIPALGLWVTSNRPNFVVDVALQLGVGAVVIVFCLAVSSVLRMSPFLKLHLFGRR